MKNNVENLDSRVVESPPTDLHDFKPFEDDQDCQDLEKLKMKEDKNQINIVSKLIDKFVKKEKKNQEMKKACLRQYMK